MLAWSRYRFVRFATDQRRETTLRLLAECFEELGGVPAVVLADRMGCLKAGTVANVVVPHPGVRALCRALRVSSGLLRGCGPGVEGRRREPGRVRSAISSSLRKGGRRRTPATVTRWCGVRK